MKIFTTRTFEACLKISYIPLTWLSVSIDYWSFSSFFPVKTSYILSTSTLRKKTSVLQSKHPNCKSKKVKMTDVEEFTWIYNIKRSVEESPGSQVALCCHEHLNLKIPRHFIWLSQPYSVYSGTKLLLWLYTAPNFPS